MAADSPLLRFRLWRAGLPPALRFLLTVNVALGVAWLVLLIVQLAGLVLPWLAFTPALALTRPWTLLTYSVFNPYGDFFSLLGFVFAVMWLNWLGRDFEEMHGAGRLYTLYGLAALVGAGVAVGIGYAFGGPWMTRVYFGAWGPAGAILCALATMHPERSVGLMFLGVIPIRWLAVGFVVLDLAFVQDPTHLAAAAVGVGFGVATKRGLDLGGWFRPRPRRQARASAPEPARRPRRSVGAEEPAAPRGDAAPRRSRAPRAATQAEVDRILDKISERGIDALTDEERRILDEYSRRA